MLASKRSYNRYSEAFKLQVVNELESGKLDSIEQASRHYGITGRTTVRSWLKKYGRNHLLPKAIRVEKPDEQDRLKALEAEIKQLKEALADSHIENIVGEARFQVICEEYGVDPEEYKKKVDTKRFSKRPRQPVKRRRQK